MKPTQETLETPFPLTEKTQVEREPFVVAGSCVINNLIFLSSTVFSFSCITFKHFFTSNPYLEIHFTTAPQDMP